MTRRKDHRVYEPRPDWTDESYASWMPQWFCADSAMDYTLENQRGTQKWRFGRCFSFSKWAFSGSMLVFRGAAHMVLIVIMILHSQGRGFRYFCSDSSLFGEIPILTIDNTSQME